MMIMVIILLIMLAGHEGLYLKHSAYTELIPVSIMMKVGRAAIVHMCVYVYIYIYMHICAHIYIYILCACICIYVCMYVCMYI